MLYKPCSPQFSKERHFTGAEENIRIFEATVERAGLELDDLAESLRSEDPEKAGFFTAQKGFLTDVIMVREIKTEITENRLQPDEAIDKIYTKYARILSQAPDPFMQERAADIRDVRRRLLRICTGETEVYLSKLEKPCIIVAAELLPSDTVSMDREKVLAIVTETGGETSHAAILARSYGIPALTGVSGATEKLRNGQIAVADAINGVLFVDPDSRTIADYNLKKRRYDEEKRIIHEYLSAEPITADGETISVMLNVASASDDEISVEKYTDGVGLFRTEFLYPGCQNPPDEEKQFGIYKNILSVFGDRPVILRTLDIGGDKSLDYLDLPVEKNPFLGNRGLRLCFDHPELFTTQLRAAFRASVYGNLWLMFPMVTNMEDIRKAKSFVENVKSELAEQGIPVGTVKLGIMIEVPSIAFISGTVSDEVDFASIGTNDLCQYLTAADRLNPLVAGYYEKYNPAVFNVIQQVVAAFRKKGKPIGVCGELGGDPAAVAVMIGLGMRKFSMGANRVAPVKKLIKSLSVQDAEDIAAHVLKLATAQEIEEYLTCIQEPQQS